MNACESTTDRGRLQWETEPLSLGVLPLTHISLQHINYTDGYALQNHHHEQVLASRESDTPELGRVLMIEHDPVITVTRRPDAPSHVLASEELLASQGVELHQTDRGGDVTYHGPGQLVCYPIIDLNAAGLRIHEYIRLLESAVIATLGEYGISAHTDPDATGVWVKPQHRFESDQAAKICAIGVRVRRWITLHGLAINLNPNMDHFGLIVPCGLAGRPVVSIAEVLGADDAPGMEELGDVLMGQIQRCLRRENQYHTDA